LLSLVGLHIGVLFAPWTFSWSGLVIACVLWWISGGLGVCLGFHRLLTHRSFQTPKWFEYLLSLFGCLAIQGSPALWAGTHRLHHRHSDAELDPHSPRHGFAWSHVWWTIWDFPSGEDPTGAAKELMSDPFYRFLHTYFWLPQVVLGVTLLGVGWAIQDWRLGASWVVWGIAVRTVLVYHFTWFVNSATHTWGYRNFETDDDSKNLWWVALLSWGEGWHNNHHAEQRCARHGRRWYEIDVTYITIRVLSWVGLARQITQPRKALD
jgi:fatty-acid desaturase